MRWDVLTSAVESLYLKPLTIILLAIVPIKDARRVLLASSVGNVAIFSGLLQATLDLPRASTHDMLPFARGKEVQHAT